MGKPRIPSRADDKEQSERFIETARESGADEGREKFERAFKRAVPPRQPNRQSEASKPRKPR